jgi:hypothetical protein
MFTATVFVLGQIGFALKLFFEKFKPKKLAWHKALKP